MILDNPELLLKVQSCINEEHIEQESNSIPECFLNWDYFKRYTKFIKVRRLKAQIRLTTLKNKKETQASSPTQEGLKAL